MKQQEGGDLVSTLINLSIPFGLVLARESVPDVSKALKRLTKKGGRKRRRTFRRNKKRKTHRRKTQKRKTQKGGNTDVEISKQFPRPTEEQLTELSELYNKAGKELSPSKIEYWKLMSENDIDILLTVLRMADKINFKDAKGEDIFTIVLSIAHQEINKRKSNVGGRRRRVQRKTKRKQRGGFMRATTRNFCQMKKL